jgi:peptidoglycan/LPS O-acetylase OafA/YrhL
VAMDSITPPANDLSSKKIASTQIHELAGIELLRFLSAFAILVWHYQHFFFVGKFDDALALEIRASLPFYSIL